MRATLIAAFLLAACGGNSPSGPKLTVTAAGPGGVTSVPAGISCRAASCSSGFSSGAAVTLTAHPDAGASFAGWTGACSGASPTCTVTVSADTTAGATFTGAGTGAQTLTVTVTGSGLVTSSPPGINCPTQCSAAFAAGTSVTLTAAGQGGADFGGWSGDCTGTSTCAVTLSADHSATATFTTPANSHKLIVSVSGNGSVVSTPAGINCPSGACASFFADGTSVSLSETPDQGQTFSGWTGACSGSGACTVNVAADASVGASFAGPGY